MSRLKRKIKSYSKPLITLLAVNILLAMLLTACQTQSQRLTVIKPPEPPLEMFNELVAHNVTPETAPNTWEWFALFYQYYDIMAVLND